MVNSRHLETISNSIAPRVFLTGASGCVGSYLLTELLEQTKSEVYVLIRTPSRLSQTHLNHRRVHVLEGDLASLSKWKRELNQTQILIHTAVQWGGPETFQVNLKQTQNLFDYLDPAICQKIFYFSTASLLGTKEQWTARSLFAGTDYIRSKAAFYISSHQSIWSPKTYFLYPTVVLGGDLNHPFSAAGQGLQNLPKWIPWLRFLKAKGVFHWIHAEDIAKLLVHWLETKPPAQHLILGNPAQSINTTIVQFNNFAQKKRAALRIPLEPVLPLLMPFLMHKMSAWDRYSLYHRDLSYESVYPQKYGLASRFSNLEAVLQDLTLSVKNPTP
jgi:nucleoside-diphosphate-sugar epimerase